MEESPAEKRLLINEEDGVIMIVALIMLALLTLVGVSASRTSSVEVMIAGNDKVSKENFYLAEAAGMEIAQRIENGGQEMKNMADPGCPVWLMQISLLSDQDDITNQDNWTDSYSQQSIDEDSRFLSIFEGVVKGSSMDMSHSRLYSYRLYGLGIRNNGQTTIEMGYRKAF